MQIEIGDRVKFKSRLPKQDVHIGWDGDDPVTRTWSEHFAGIAGVVVSVDPINQEAFVRGVDGDGSSYTVQIHEKYLDITEQGIPR